MLISLYLKVSILANLNLLKGKYKFKISPNVLATDFKHGIIISDFATNHVMLSWILYSRRDLIS